jgi:hypothetical protein
VHEIVVLLSLGHVLEKLTSKGKSSILNRFGGFFLAAVVAAFAVRFGAECIATGVYIKCGLEQLTIKGKGSVLNRLTGFFFSVVVAVFAVLIGGATAKAQNTAVTGSVPSGLASDQVLQLTLRDAVNMALRYNLEERSKVDKTLRLPAVSGYSRLAICCHKSAPALRERPASEPRHGRALWIKRVGHPDSCWPFQLQLGRWKPSAKHCSVSSPPRQLLCELRG